MTEKTQEPLELPKKFDKCPACGSTRRFTKEAMADIDPVYKDSIPPGLFRGEMIYMTALGVPWKVSGFVDICLDCGMAYCVEMNKEQGEITEIARRDLASGLQEMGLVPPGS